MLGIFIAVADHEILLREAWDGSDNEARVALQNQVQCCGLDTYNDAKAGRPCPQSTDQPCFQALNDELNSNFQLVALLGVAVTVVELIGLFGAVCLQVCIGRQRRKQQKATSI